MDTKESLQALAALDLSKFRVVPAWEVYTVDHDDHRITIGFFESRDAASVFAGLEYKKCSFGFYVTEAFAITDGEAIYVFHGAKPVEFLDKAQLGDIRKGVLAKLTPEEQRFLGIVDLVPTAPE